MSQIREEVGFTKGRIIVRGKLVTRGTYTLDSGSPTTPLGEQRLTLTLYGNLWQFAATHTLLIELTNVDSPYISPSKVPSVSKLSGLQAVIPAR